MRRGDAWEGLKTQIDRWQSQKARQHISPGRECRKGHRALTRVNGGCVECIWIRKREERSRSPRKLSCSPISDLPGSRSEALVLGIPSYFTGVPCSNGHICNRLTSNWSCIKCTAVSVRASRQRNYESYLDSNKAWRIRNPDKSRAIQRKSSNARRARKLKAQPIWVDETEMKKIYFNCPPGFEVDHIMPLASPILCGLHVPWNLQYLPKRENRLKGNKVILSC